MIVNENPTDQLLSIKKELKLAYKIFQELNNTNNSESTTATRLLCSHEEEDILLQKCQSLMYQLLGINVNLKILMSTKACLIVSKFSKQLTIPSNNSRSSVLVPAYKHLIRTATILLMRWEAVAGCLDLAWRVRNAFRERKSQLEREGRAKPDMIAYKELRHQALNTKYKQVIHGRQHGELKGVPIGLLVQGRAEAGILGIHNSIMSGIHYEKDQPCYAVCMSGKYNDYDAKDSSTGFNKTNGTIIYTGMGGLSKNAKHQMEDQTKNPANISLILSFQTRCPIRVLRKVGLKTTSTVYRYLGLYQCTDYNYESSDDGPMVYKFSLEPMDLKCYYSFTSLEKQGVGSAQDPFIID